MNSSDSELFLEMLTDFGIKFPPSNINGLGAETVNRTIIMAIIVKDFCTLKTIFLIILG